MKRTHSPPCLRASGGDYECHFRFGMLSSRVANVEARAVRYPNETVDGVGRQRDLRIRCTGADRADAALANMSPSAAAIGVGALARGVR